MLAGRQMCFQLGEFRNLCDHRQPMTTGGPMSLEPTYKCSTVFSFSCSLPKELKKVLLVNSVSDSVRLGYLLVLIIAESLTLGFHMNIQHY